MDKWMKQSRHLVSSSCLDFMDVFFRNWIFRWCLKSVGFTPNLWQIPNSFGTDFMFWNLNLIYFGCLKLWDLHPKQMANLMGNWWADLGADGCYPILLVSRADPSGENGDQTCGGYGFAGRIYEFQSKKWGAYHEWWPFWGGIDIVLSIKGLGIQIPDSPRWRMLFSLPPQPLWFAGELTLNYIPTGMNIILYVKLHTIVQ
jgi:hypothetical protein